MTNLFLPHLASTETSSTPLGGRCVPTGPTPEKGSVQYRFRQLLMDKSNNRTATPSRSFPSMVTNQISQITGQGVKPDASGLPLNPMTNSCRINTILDLIHPFKYTKLTVPYSAGPNPSATFILTYLSSYADYGFSANDANSRRPGHSRSPECPGNPGRPRYSGQSPGC